MPCNPLRDEHVKNLLANLKGSSTDDGKQLIAKWLADGRITKEELLGLSSAEQSRLLGAPSIPFANYTTMGWASGTAEGRERIAAWEAERETWRRTFLAGE